MVAEEKDGVVNYYHTDHLGSTRLVTDSTGAVVASYKFNPYGEVDTHTGTDIKYGFTGKENDADTGLTYFGARFYDPEIGRFITQDPAKDGLNWYAYCYNNPLGYVDPDGHMGQAVATWGQQAFNGGPNPGMKALGGLVFLTGLAILYFEGQKYIDESNNNNTNNNDSASFSSEVGNCKGGDRTPGGRTLTDHAAQQANKRGFSPDRIDKIIDNNKREPGHVDEFGRKTWEYTDNRGNKVVVNENGDVVTVHGPSRTDGGKYAPSNKEKSSDNNNNGSSLEKNKNSSNTGN
jgi:RHS repeat-associated protein